MLARFASFFAGQDCLFFVDNEGALAALVRSSSGQPDAEFVCQVTHCLLLLLHVRAWWDWVDSRSNPADPLSREGAASPRCVSGEWTCDELQDRDFPSWSSSACPWAAATALLAAYR